PPREPPRHPEPVQRLPAQPQNVPGLVAELITRVFVPAIAVGQRSPDTIHAPPAVGMEQTFREFAREFLDDDLLPCSQLDFPMVLASRAMLREQTRPVLRVALDHRAPLLPDTADPRRGHDSRQCPASRLHDAWPVVGAGHPEYIHVPGPTDDMAVAE